MSVRDAINHALQDNPSELKNSIYSALDAKVADSLELKKISTASEYFNMPEEEEYYEEEEETFEARDPRTPYDPDEDKDKYFAGSSKTRRELEREIEKKKGTRKKGRDPRGITFTGQEK
jgi:hypothetical protein